MKIIKKYMDREFLNKKTVPTIEELLSIFFNEENTEELDDKINASKIDFNSLGKPDEVESVSGVIWTVTKFGWNTPKGKVFKIDLKPMDDDFIVSSRRNFYPINSDIEDIDYEDVPLTNLTYQDLLNDALENEDYDEAIRLREYNNGLKNLLFDLKPIIVKAIDEFDIVALDAAQLTIKNYRSKL